MLYSSYSSKNIIYIHIFILRSLLHHGFIYVYNQIINLYYINNIVIIIKLYICIYNIKSDFVWKLIILLIVFTFVFYPKFNNNKFNGNQCKLEKIKIYTQELAVLDLFLVEKVNFCLFFYFTLLITPWF